MRFVLWHHLCQNQSCSPNMQYFSEICFWAIAARQQQFNSNRECTAIRGLLLQQWASSLHHLHGQGTVPMTFHGKLSHGKLWTPSRTVHCRDCPSTFQQKVNTQESLFYTNALQICWKPRRFKTIPNPLRWCARTGWQQCCRPFKTRSLQACAMYILTFVSLVPVPTPVHLHWCAHSTR